jgi:hypothetical protein
MPTKLRGPTSIASNRIHGTYLFDVFDQTAELTIPERTEAINYDNARLAMFYTNCTHRKTEMPSLREQQQVTQEISNVEESGHKLTNFFGAYHYAFWKGNGVPQPVGRDYLTIASNWVVDKKLRFIACNAMIPRIPRYCSILNFLYELKDLPHMFKIWRARLDTLKNISSGILNWSFGWRPFLQDVCTILKVCQTFQEKLRKFIANFHKVNVRHYQKSLLERDKYNVRRCEPAYEWFIDEGVPYAPYVRDSNGNYVYINLNASLISKHEIVPKYVATMKFTYWSPDLLKRFGKLGAFLDAFGVYWDPQIIWDAIPFSFIVDWFYNFGDFLSSWLAHPNTNVQFRIIDFCASVKASMTTKGTFVVPFGASDGHGGRIPNPVQHWQERDAIYVRKPLIPILEDPDPFGNPIAQIDKIVLSLALGHNTSRPHKKAKAK